MFLSNMPFRPGAAVFAVPARRPAARVLLDCDGKHFGSSFGKGTSCNNCAEFVRFRIPVPPSCRLTRCDPRGAARGAHVTTLGDFATVGNHASKTICWQHSAPDDHARLSSQLEFVPLPRGKVLCEASCASGLRVLSDDGHRFPVPRARERNDGRGRGHRQRRHGRHRRLHGRRHDDPRGGAQCRLRLPDARERAQGGVRRQSGVSAGAAALCAGTHRAVDAFRDVPRSPSARPAIPPSPAGEHGSAALRTTLR